MVDHRETESLDISLVVLASARRPDLILFREAMETWLQELRVLGRSFEILVVDDGAGTAFMQAAREIAAKDPQVKMLRFRRSFGESIALAAAVDQARGRYVLTTTWYVQVDPKGIGRAVDVLDSGVDFVSGRRMGRVDGRLARLQSQAFNAYTRWMVKAPLHDLNCSFRAFRRQVVEELSFHGDMFRFLGVLALRQGFRVEELELRHVREEGPSTFFNLGLIVRRVLDIISLFFLLKFTRKPLRFFGMAGVFFILVGAAITAQMAWIRLVEREALSDRPILVLGIFLIVLGFMLGGIGLIGEIIIFTLNREIRDYHIDRIVDGGSEARPSEEPPPQSVLRVAHMNAHHEEKWRDYVMQHPQATLFHDLVWRDALLDTFKHKPRYLIALRGPHVVGVLPLFVVRSVFFGTSVISVPFGVYGGVLADDEECSRALLDEARGVARTARAQYVELRHLEVPDGVAELPTSDLYHTFIRELPDTEEECLQLLPRKARAEARKARKKGEIEVKHDAIDLDDFHALFVANKCKLGSPPFPRSLFWHLMEHYGERCTIISVHHEGEIVSAVMSFIFKDSYMAYYSGASDSANRLSANNLMYLAAMEDAVRRGMRTFDFGRSRAGTGSFQFKKNQGFEARPLAYQYLLEEGQSMPAINASNPRFAIGKKLFQKMPTFAARKLGSFVSKRMPV